KIFGISALHGLPHLLGRGALELFGQCAALCAACNSLQLTEQLRIRVSAAELLQKLIQIMHDLSLPKIHFHFSLCAGLQDRAF
ncbi:MAG: hypothetical protein IIY16_06140, partial [Oscillospiraceae bacterium]|nr:hypothetical protein [Oscillospiraceae bacterium]